MSTKPAFRHFALAAALAFAGFASEGAPSAAEPERPPVVLELFTSQGCSSCPAADALLGELAARDDVLPLSLHVDYWNYIGWVDPYASEANTVRQKAYMHAMRTSYVYTPQLVIDGRQHVVGSDRGAVEAAIEQAKSAPGVHLKVAIDEQRGGRMTVKIPKAELKEPATVLLLMFDRKHDTKVTAGENDGRAITNHRVVRGMKKIGRYDGTETEIAFDAASAMPGVKGDGCAVILQSERSGAIVGAGMAWASSPGS